MTNRRTEIVKLYFLHFLLIRLRFSYFLIIKPYFPYYQSITMLDIFDIDICLILGF